MTYVCFVIFLGSARRIANFGEDIKDIEVYDTLLRQISPREKVMEFGYVNLDLVSSTQGGNFVLEGARQFLLRKGHLHWKINLSVGTFQWASRQTTCPSLPMDWIHSK